MNRRSLWARSNLFSRARENLTYIARALAGIDRFLQVGVTDNYHIYSLMFMDWKSIIYSGLFLAIGHK